MPVNKQFGDTVSNQLEEHDSASHQACYVFKPPSDVYQDAERPKKKRKITKAPLSLGKGSQAAFPPLLNGAEKHENIQIRHAAFQELWKKQQSHVDGLLDDVHSSTLEEVATFVRIAPKFSPEKISTGLILAGPNIAGHGKLFDQLEARILVEDVGPVVILRSGHASNLKTVLKQLIKAVTSQTQGLEEDDLMCDQTKGPKLLNYDLQVLYNYVQTNHIEKVVVGFQDSEAFDGALLADLIALFHSWRDRITFILLFGIATSEELFHDKLPRPTIRCMQGEKFDVGRVEESLESVFIATTARRDSELLWLGPSLSKMLLERQRNHVQSVQAFIMALKYAYMAHFYANPLSILLTSDPSRLSLQSEHFEAIRNLPSFRRFAEENLAEGRVEVVRDLLDDDVYLWKTVLQRLQEGQGTVNSIICALEHIHIILSSTQKTDIQRSELYVKAMSGNLTDSVMIRDALLSLKKMPSDRLDDLLSEIPGVANTELSGLHNQLRRLVKGLSSNGKALRSEHDVRHETLRTTVVAQRVELSKQKSSLSSDDAAYSKIVNSVHAVLQSYFSRTLINPSTLFLHEVFIYDLRSPHRDVFTAKPRFAIERALSAPHDYLACICCKSSDQGLSPTQPSTAILFQLYLESGALINIFDLWSAFYATVGQDEDDAKGDDDEPRILALFYKALADLKFLGLVKQSRKKTDHVAKLAWKGL